MATLNQVRNTLNYGSRYSFKGRLFRDKKRDTATLYIYIIDTHTDTSTSEIRIGYKQFEDSQTQQQTDCVERSSGVVVSGIKTCIFAPCGDVDTYQIDIMLNQERYTLHWHTTPNSNNLVASSDAEATPFESLFRQQNSKLQSLLDKLN